MWLGFWWDRQGVRQKDSSPSYQTCREAREGLKKALPEPLRAQWHSLPFPDGGVQSEAGLPVLLDLTVIHNYTVQHALVGLAMYTWPNHPPRQPFPIYCPKL